MTAEPTAPPVSDDLVARLAAAAYEVALRHGLRAPFIDVELALWRELRAVAESDAPDRPEVVPCRP
jgi:hypothetical protein